jgi:hypothetical protein
VSGTTWCVMYDGAVLTWERTVRLGNEVASDRWQELLAGLPLQFDEARDLSSKQAQELVVWLKSWLPREGQGLRLSPRIPTHHVASQARDKPKPVRV